MPSFSESGASSPRCLTRGVNLLDEVGNPSCRAGRDGVPEGASRVETAVKHLCRVSSTTWLESTSTLLPAAAGDSCPRRITGSTSASVTSTSEAGGRLRHTWTNGNRATAHARVLIGMQRLPHEALKDAAPSLLDEIRQPLIIWLRRRVCA